jgi:hypothetical protein
MTYLEPIISKRRVPECSQEQDNQHNSLPEHTFVLSQREAKAASPENFAVCGEEDPGEGLEFLVADREETEK